MANPIVEAFIKEHVSYWDGSPVIHEADLRRLIAALSAQPGPVGAEPVAWMTKVVRPDGSMLGEPKLFEEKPKTPGGPVGSGGLVLEVIPLYTSPPPRSGDACDEAHECAWRPIKDGKYEAYRCCFCGDEISEAELVARLKRGRAAKGGEGMVCVPRESLSRVVQLAGQAIVRPYDAEWNEAFRTLQSALSTTNGGER